MLTAVLACGAVLLVLLLIPVHIELALERDPELEMQVGVSWLFGLVRVRPRRAERRERRRSRAPRAGRRSRIGRRVAGGLARPELRARALALLRALVRALRPRDLRLWARIGLDDPADTGRAWGFLGPLGVLLPARVVRLEPDFTGPCLRFRAAGRVRLIPAQLLFVLLLLGTPLLLSPPVLRAFAAR